MDWRKGSGLGYSVAMSETPEENSEEKPEAKPEEKPSGDAEAKSEASSEVKSEAEPEGKPDQEAAKDGAGSADEDDPQKKPLKELFFTWTRNDIIQTSMFLAWIVCICYVMAGTEHLLAALLVGLIVGGNYSFLAIFHVNSIGAKEGERAKNISLIFLAPSVFLGLLSLLKLFNQG